MNWFIVFVVFFLVLFIIKDSHWGNFPPTGGSLTIKLT